MKLSSKHQFYLKHRIHIDEWVGLRSAVVAEAAKCFASVVIAARAMTEQMATTDRPTLESMDHDGLTCSLFRPHWIGRPGLPRLAVALYLDPQYLFEGFSAAIAIDEAHSKSLRLREELNVRLNRTPELIRDYPPLNGWWCLWKPLVPTEPNYWDHIELFEEQLVTTLKEWWIQFSPLIEDAIQAVP